MAQAIRIVDYGWTEAAAFGVTFDGVTDDYAAMQRAVERLDAGTRLIMGQGTMLLSASVNCIDLPGITIDGAGPGQALNLDYGTRVRPQGNFPAFKLGHTSGITVNKNPVHCTLRNFQIYGTSTGTSQHGVVIAATEAASYQAAFNKLENLVIWNCGGDGVKFTDNAWNNVIERCQIYANDGHGVSAYEESNSNMILHCHLQSNGGSGLYLEGLTHSFTVFGGSSEGNAAWGANINDINVRGTSFIGVYMESNAAGQMQNKGNATSVHGGAYFVADDAAWDGIDIFKWSGNDGGVWGVYTGGHCQYIFNLASSIRPTIMGNALNATASIGKYNLDSTTKYMIADENNKLTVPVLLATSASSPKLTALDTTNNLEVVLQADDTNGFTGTSSNHGFYVETNGTQRLKFDADGNVAVGTAALATNATDGFFNVTTSAGLPSGTPTAFTGRAPIHIDTTNGRIYTYYGGSWHYAALT